MIRARSLFALCLFGLFSIIRAGYSIPNLPSSSSSSRFRSKTDRTSFVPSSTSSSQHSNDTWIFASKTWKRRNSPAALKRTKRQTWSGDRIVYNSAAEAAAAADAKRQFCFSCSSFEAECTFGVRHFANVKKVLCEGRCYTNLEDLGDGVRVIYRGCAAGFQVSFKGIGSPTCTRSKSNMWCFCSSSAFSSSPSSSSTPCNGRDIIETLAESDECDSNPCKNGGICTDGMAEFRCTCPGGWSGDTCENYIGNGPQPTPETGVTYPVLPSTPRPQNTCASTQFCANGGTCFFDGTKSFCTCNIGFTGQRCGTVLCGTFNVAMGGVATASSSLDAKTRPENAFQGPFAEWHSKKGFPPDEWIQYEFPDEKLICRFSFKSRSDNSLGHVPHDGPMSYKFQGSRDAVGSIWETLFQVPVSEPWSVSEQRVHEITTPKPFKKYRLLINDVPGRGGGVGGGKFVLIRDFRMYTVDDNPCLSRPCRGAATCVNLGSGFVCECPPFHGGKYCEALVDACGSSPCLNGGTCKGLKDLSFLCECPAGFAGIRCETSYSAACQSAPCLNGGFCREDEETFQFECLCPYPFFGRNCERSAPSAGSSSYIACPRNRCINGGRCVSVPRATSSTLSSSSSSSTPSIYLTSSSSTSSAPDARFRCVCPAGVFGASCEFVQSPTAGFDCANLPDGKYATSFCSDVFYECRGGGIGKRDVCDFSRVFDDTKQKCVALGELGC